jgi:hypothetical protein
MNRIENLIGQKVVHEFPVFYGRRNFITFWQNLMSDPCPEPDESGPRPLALFI